MYELEHNIVNLLGQKGKDWLKNIPNITARLAKQWQLVDIKPVPNMTWNYVAKATSWQYGPVCLKMSASASLISDEVKALLHFDGHAMVKMLAHDMKEHALLLNQAIPGASLHTLYRHSEAQTIQNYAKVVKTLMAAKQVEPTNYATVSYWLRAFDHIDSHALPAGLLEKAKKIRASLLSRPSKNLVLHGDLHLDNVISDGQDWLAIDPKGVLGTVEFEAAGFDFVKSEEFNQTSDVVAIFQKRSQLLSDALGIDHTVLVDWVFVRLVLGACWMIQDNGSPEIFLKRLKAIFPVLSGDAL